jgi:hypothetical protein
MSENIYTEEQKYIIKPEAFGKRSDLKRTKHLKYLKKNKRRSLKIYK